MSALSVEDALEAAGSSLEKAASLLWRLDQNRLLPDVDYVLNTQTQAYSNREDNAAAPLFEFVSDDVWTRPTYASFRRLLDNYEASTGKPERVSDTEREEENTFLSAIAETPCIRFVHEWLMANTDAIDSSSMDDFCDLMRDLWFSLYGRDARGDSSGFEHVFCGELDDGRVKGLHNYIQVIVEELRGNFNYMGYLDFSGEFVETAPSKQNIITIKFEWLGEVKTASSMFVGVSPEFEVALYTLIWFSSAPGSVVKLGPYTVRVKMYDLRGKLGAAFPDLIEIDEDALIAEAQAPSHEDEQPPFYAAPENDESAWGAAGDGDGGESYSTPQDNPSYAEQFPSLGS